MYVELAKSPFSLNYSPFFQNIGGGRAPQDPLLRNPWINEVWIKCDQWKYLRTVKDSCRKSLDLLYSPLFDLQKCHRNLTKFDWMIGLLLILSGFLHVFDQVQVRVLVQVLGEWRKEDHWNRSQGHDRLMQLPQHLKKLWNHILHSVISEVILKSVFFESSTFSTTIFYFLVKFPAILL